MSEEKSDPFKERLQFYKEENAKMERIFLKLGILNNDLELDKSLEEIVNKMDKCQENFGTKDFSTNAFSLSFADKQKNYIKNDKFLNKLKTSNEIYIKLNSDIMREIEKMKWELKESKKEINNLSVSSAELHLLEEKIKKYEIELSHFEKKFPFLKNEQYNLCNISDYINSLKKLREEKNELQKELSVYRGLKPDLKEAMEQLAQIKIKHQDTFNKMVNVLK